MGNKPRNLLLFCTFLLQGRKIIPTQYRISGSKLFNNIVKYKPGEGSLLGELLRYRPVAGASRAYQTAPGIGPAAP